jgi:hypothetical protein
MTSPNHKDESNPNLTISLPNDRPLQFDSPIFLKIPSPTDTCFSYIYLARVTKICFLKTWTEKRLLIRELPDNFDRGHPVVLIMTIILNIRSRVQKFPAWHTKAAPNGKCCEGYIVPSTVRLMYQLKSVLK